MERARRWMTMDPEIFLLPDEIPELVNVLKDFVTLHSPKELKQALELSEMDVSELNFPESAPGYAQEVVLAWKKAKVSDKRPGGYHPLVSVTEYLLQVYQWDNKKKQLLDKLLE